MKTNWKHPAKPLSALLLLIGLAGIVGCQAQSTSSSGGSQDTGTVTYKIFRNFSIPDYPQDGGKAKPIIQDKSGIKGLDYSISMVSGPDYLTKLNVMAAAGQLPDVFYVDVPTLAKFADQGLILPLDDYLKKTPNLMKVLKPDMLEQVKYNGHIYALPSGYRPEPFNGPNVKGFEVRQDWLDSLHLQQPKTLEDLHNVLKEFTFNDPDKNGANDTYGLSGISTDNFDGIFGAFGIEPTQWINRNNQLKQGMVLPETKQVLTVLQQWYKEGLIDPDFPLMNQQQLQTKVINSKIGVFSGQAFDVDPKQDMITALRHLTPTANLAILPPPMGPNGQQGWSDGGGLGMMMAISAKTANPDKLMKFIDWESTDDGANLVTYGVEGQDFNYDKANNRIIQLIAQNNDLYKEGFGNPIRLVQVTDRRWAQDNTIAALGVTNKYLIKNEFYKSVPAMLDYPDLNKMWTEYFTKIITGVWPVDKWDEFVQQYYQQGGKTIEDQVNAEWKKQQGQK